MIKKQKEPIEFITKKEATFLLVFKNNRPVPKLIKQDYLKPIMWTAINEKCSIKMRSLSCPKKSHLFLILENDHALQPN